MMSDNIPPTVPIDTNEGGTVESPHFRPAVIDGDVALESPGQVAKKRKSLGRRVSFAAKAKVRFIDKDSDGDDGNVQKEAGDEDNMEDDNIFLVSKPDFVVSPRRSSATKAALVIERNSPRSEGALSAISNESIEVELRDPASSSFSSYDSVTEENVNQLDDMEMTKCVGGIIGANTGNNSMLEDADGNNTMDLTGCVGGILSNLPVAPPTSPTSVDTMELTRVVGGIMENLGIVNSPANKHKQVNGDDDAMDMTVVLKDTIKATIASSKLQPRAEAQNPPASPSPFLVNGNGVASPSEAINGDSVLAMMAPISPVHSEISFIGDMDQPKDFAFAASPAPSRQVMDAQEQADLDLTTELFNKYIDTSRFNALTLDTQADSQLAYGSQMTEIKFSQTSAPALPKTPAKGSLTHGPLLGPPSQTESPTVTLILPRASLKDFLNETGVRFLDNLSSLTRRETTGRPRESEMVTEAKQLYVDCGLSLEGDALDEACRVLAKQIESVRDELVKQEEQFNHSPPLAFLQYRDPQERASVIGKLKTFKSIARLFAKQAWYEWRRPVHSRLNQALASNAQVLQERLDVLGAVDTELDRLITHLEPVVAGLAQVVSQLEERSQKFTTDDIEQVVQMELLANEQQDNIAKLDCEMEALVKREQELRASIDAALQRRQELHSSVTNLRQQLEAVPECSPIILDELRSGFQLLQGVTGWKVLQASSNQISLFYHRAGVGVNLFLNTSNTSQGPCTVEEITFDISSVKSRLLKHVPRIVKIALGLSVSRCLVMIGQKLDRLCHLDKQLSIVGVQCTVSIPESLGPQLEAVPLALGFYHAQNKIKFDLLLTVDGDTLSYSQFVPFAGNLQEDSLVDVINLSLMQKWHPIRRLVTAVTEIIEQQSE